MCLGTACRLWSGERRKHKSDLTGLKTVLIQILEFTVVGQIVVGPEWLFSQDLALYIT